MGFLGITVTWEPVSLKAKKVLCDHQWTDMGDFPQEGTGDLETCLMSGGGAFGPNDLGVSSREKGMGCFV